MVYLQSANRKPFGCFTTFASMQSYQIPNPDYDFKRRALSFAQRYSTVCFLDSNSFTPESSIGWVLAIGGENYLTPVANCFGELKHFQSQNKNEWLFGFLTYDLKNEKELLSSKNVDHIGLPKMHFFVPELLFISQNNTLQLCTSKALSKTELSTLLESIKNQSLTKETSKPVDIKPRISKDEYVSRVKKIQHHIQRGDVYEVTFCSEFFVQSHKISPLETFTQLQQISPSPFSAFYKFDEKYLLCSSPERFLTKKGNQLIAQPIKGTAPRAKTPLEDEEKRHHLKASAKEQIENVMIVDLVRNDLSQSAKKGSVKVDELYGIYSFPQVHQMISTVSATLDDSVHFIDAIKNTFPMGSMTGAPKIRAMELIEEYESTYRGLFSGAVGYINPSENFDFNVVIRSILYNSENQYLSMQVGSAITANSVPENEYEECLWKAEGMLKALNAEIAIKETTC